MLLAASYAPVYPERPVQELGPVRKRNLRAHEPNPALVLDRHSNMLAANATAPLLLRGVADPALLPCERAAPLAPPRRSRAAHPQFRGVARASPAKARRRRGTLGRRRAPRLAGIAVPLETSVDGLLLRSISTTTVFGSPIDATLSEIALESFSPADAATAETLNQRHSDGLVAAAAAP